LVVSSPRTRLLVAMVGSLDFFIQAVSARLHNDMVDAILWSAGTVAVFGVVLIIEKAKNPGGR